MDELKNNFKFAAFAVSLKSLAVPLPPFCDFLDEILTLACDKIRDGARARRFRDYGVDYSNERARWITFCNAALRLAGDVLSEHSTFQVSLTSRCFYLGVAAYYGLDMQELNHGSQLIDLANALKAHPLNKDNFKPTSETKKFIRKYTRDWTAKVDSCVRRRRYRVDPYLMCSPSETRVTGSSLCPPPPCFPEPTSELHDKIARLEKKLCELQAHSAESEMISLAKLIEKNLHEEALTNEANKSRNCLQYLKNCPTENNAASST